MNQKNQSRRRFLEKVTAGVAASAAADFLHARGAEPEAWRKREQGRAERGGAPDPIFVKPAPITMAELAKLKLEGVRAVEVSDYVYGNYQGEFLSPPHADFNPRKAVILVWEDKPYKFVFWHEASYCPFFQLPSGAGPCFQFWESNFGGELFNQYGRMERNSFVHILESGPERVWVRWTYFDIHEKTGGPPVVRGTDDFVSYPNGIVWRRQVYQSFYPDKHEAHCASPLDFFAAMPAGVHYSELLPRDEKHGDYLVGTFLDAYSDKQYNVYWDTSDKRKSERANWWSGPFYARRTGAESFLDIERSPGRAAIQTFRDGLAYCTFGDASGYVADRVQLWDNSHADTGPCNWGNFKWSNWPIGWINSGAEIASDDDIRTMPYCICPLSMCFVPKPYPMQAAARTWENILKGWHDKEHERWVEGRVFYCLHGVERDFQTVRRVSRRWLDQGTACARPESVRELI
jgi:hypothetical protein